MLTATLPFSAFLGALLASLSGLFLLAFPVRQRTVVREMRDDVVESVLLLRDGQVVDVSPDATEDRVGVNLVGADWTYLHLMLRERFPDCPLKLPTQSMVISSGDGTGAVLRLEPKGDNLRLVLEAPVLGAAEQHSFSIMFSDHSRLWSVIDACPHPAWLTNDEGTVIWHNATYYVLCRSLQASDGSGCPFDIKPAEGEHSFVSRISLMEQDRKRHWYEVTTTRTASGNAHIATSIDALIEAEQAQRNFVQTLTKTFAHLPTGLAIFDKDHRLVLFNPALMDLTNLDVEFLSSRPSLTGFFDQLREARILPEPKNYVNWRDGLAEVVAAAQDDRYSETWNLPSGLTYRVVGRPHPDGALAFLIEDISAEISLTRRFRSELELSQSVVDCFDEAVAVFSRLGVLSFCNNAYKALWACDPEDSIVETTIVDATQLWRSACSPSLIWPELREFVLTLTNRASWDTTLNMKSGVELLCRVEPLTSGATLVRFQRIGSEHMSDDARLQERA